jgi:hypothetical protein
VAQEGFSAPEHGRTRSKSVWIGSRLGGHQSRPDGSGLINRFGKGLLRDGVLYRRRLGTDGGLVGWEFDHAAEAAVRSDSRVKM